MQIKRKVPLIIGIVITILGVVAVLDYFGIISIPIPGFASVMTSAGHSLGISVTNQRITYPLTLSTVGTGYAYKWKTIISNTGGVAWNTGWTKARIGIAGTTATLCTCSACSASCGGQSSIGGSFYVESGTCGKDVSACRETLENWGFKWSADGTTWNSGCTGTYPGSSVAAKYVASGDKVCSIDLGVVAAATTKSIYWQLTVPSAVTGTYPFMVQSFGYADATYAVGGSYDNLIVGAVSGDTTLAFIGFLSLIGGLAMVVAGFI